MDEPRVGKITIAPEVILDTVRQAALYLDDVVSLAPAPARADRLFKRTIAGEGVVAHIDENSITIDLYLITRAVKILDLSRRVQQEVKRAIEKLVGLDVIEVNVHVEDIAYPDNITS